VSNKDLLLEIQKEAIEGSSALSTVLRKCVLFASRLGNKPLKTWAQWELNGYPESSEVPEYRVVKGLQFYGDFVDPAGSVVIKNAPVSVLGLPEPFRDQFSNYRVWIGVEEIAEETRSQTERWSRVAWPAEAYGVFKNEDYSDDLRLVHAWTFLPVSHFVGLLDSIRNRVLEFTIEIGTLDLKLENSVLSEESKKATSEQITQTFHQTIYGPVSNVGTAGSISQTMIVNRGDLTGLKDRLRETGLPELDLQELEKAVKADEAEPKPPEHHFGKNVAKWMGDTLKKTATGMIKVGTDVIATVATKALKDYYGVG
jgi:hypothetical protein